MKFGVVVPTYDRYGDAAVIRRLFQEIEALGFDSAWFGDHIITPTYAAHLTDPHWYEALSCALFGMGMTTNLSFGTDVLVAPYRNPLLLAKMAATASELSGGRLMLGMGVGYIHGEFEALGAPPYKQRGEVTEEYLRVMRALFTAKGPVSFAGKWVNFDDVQFGPAPRSAPPLLVGGNHRRAVERAARLGDGWHPLFTTPEEYARGRNRILEIRKSEGFDGPFTFSYSCCQTRVLAPGEAPPAKLAGYSGDIPEEFSYAPPAPLRPDGQPYLIGTARQVREDISALAEAGVEQVALRFALPFDPDITLEPHLEQLRRFAGDVLPHFR